MIASDGVMASHAVMCCASTCLCRRGVPRLPCPFPALSLLWKRMRQKRQYLLKRIASYNVCLALGLLMVLSAPAIRRHNKVVTQIRQDGGTVSYNLRSDLAFASFVSGGGLILIGWLGRSEVRRVSGKVARFEASLVADAMLGSVLVFGFRAIPALVYLPSIYATSGGNIRRDVIGQDVYLWLSIGLMCAGGFLAFLIGNSRSRRLRHLKSEYGPTCGNCGYSLRGLDSPICPECGQPSVDLPSHANR